MQHTRRSKKDWELFLISKTTTEISLFTFAVLKTARVELYYFIIIDIRTGGIVELIIGALRKDEV